MTAIIKMTTGTINSEEGMVIKKKTVIIIFGGLMKKKTILEKMHG